MAFLELSFFNTFDVSAQGKRIASFRSAKVAGLLVYLVLEAKTTHTRDRLAALFWPDEPVTRAKKNLRQTLYQLRKLVGEADGHSQPLLHVTRQTAQFNSESDTVVDVVLFQAAVARGDLDLAETYYSGPLLPAFSCDSRPFEDWLENQRQSLQQAALNVLSELAERQLALGKAAVSRALALARRQLDLEPWREEAHRQLMRGLALSGDRSGAIAQFDVCSDVLADELGVSPAPETFALFDAIRDGTYPPADEKGQVAAIPNNIPHQATPLVGRSAEIDQLLTHLHDPDTRLITIDGPGGMGKTRLALETARSLLDSDAAEPFPGGVFLVELAAATSREEMLAACATAFGFALEREPEPLQQIVNFLSNKQMLLLLDNVEQLIPSPSRAAEVVATWVKGAPDVTVLVTSRQKLNLTGERVLPLDGLALPDQAAVRVESSAAIQLFAESARRVQPTFQLTDHNAVHVAQICRLAGGMPLGILLTAAWSHLLQPAEIVIEMQADVDFVAVDMPDLPARQRSMRAVFENSWLLLSQPEQRTLAELSVFRGGFTREAAQAVTGATLPVLLGLVNKSLLQRDVESGRFNLHELVRQLAAEKLASDGDVEAVRTAHSRYYLYLFEKHKSVTFGKSQREAYRALTADDQNIQTAWLRAAATDDATHMLAILEPFHFYFGHTGRDFEMARLYREALVRLPPGDPSFADTADDTTLIRASILNRMQDRGLTDPEYDTVIDIDRLHAYFRACGAVLEEAITCQHLGFRALARRDVERAVFLLQRQAELYEQIGAVFRLTHSLISMSNVAFRVGQVELGLRLARRGLALAEDNNDRLTRPGALAILAVHTLGAHSDYAAADARFAEVTALGTELWSEGLTASVAVVGFGFQAYIALLQGNLTKAQQVAHRVQKMVAMRNNPRDAADAKMFQYLIDATVGTYRVIDPEQLQLVSLGHRWFADFATRLNACGLGQTEAAAASLIQELSVPLTMIWPSIILANLPIAAAVVLKRGEPMRAVELLAMGRAHPACPGGWWEIMDLVQTMDARLKAELSPAAYAEAQARGQSLDVQETAKALLDNLKGHSM